MKLLACDKARRPYTDDVSGVGIHRPLLSIDAMRMIALAQFLETGGG
jgi:hypothetical protein